MFLSNIIHNSFLHKNGKICLLLPEAFSQQKKSPKCICSLASTPDPAGELTTLPKSPIWLGVTPLSISHLFATRLASGLAALELSAPSVPQHAAPVQIIRPISRRL